MKYILLFFILIGCSKKEPKVYLVKQWHLSPQTSTEDIEQGKKLPHFTNQKDIFLWAKDKIAKGESTLVIAEGCEGKMESDYAKQFNSWTMKKLISKKDDKNFDDILAPVPMKLKALFPKLEIICGDNETLIKANLEAASEMRGFFGFYSRLLEAKNSGKDEVYAAYSAKIESLYPKLGPVDKLKFTKLKLKEAINSFESLLLERNQYFIKQVKKHIHSHPILIIGGLHVKDIAEKLESDKVSYEVIVPKGYDDSEQSLLKNLKSVFSIREVSNFMLPQGFDLSRFDFSKQIPAFKDKKVMKTLMDLLKENSLPEGIVLSDFDGDGIRDFTLSTSSEKVILSSEDQDWDNDGIHNLIDTDLGPKVIAEISANTPLVNNYMTQVNEKELVEEIKQSFSLIQREGHHHEVLVLEVVSLLKTKLKLNFKNIKFIQSADLSHSYGKNSFFQYTAVSQAISYDTSKLYNYIKKEFGQFTKYDQALSFKKFINSYVIPLLIHSLSHEVAHSLDMDITGYLKDKGWQWKDEPITNEYLVKYRHPKKKLSAIKQEVRFKGKSYQEWLEVVKSAKGPLNRLGVPSIYSLSKPSEWFAEMYAMCAFVKAYPESVKQSERYEKILGINPSSVAGQDCQSFGL